MTSSELTTSNPSRSLPFDVWLDVIQFIYDDKSSLQSLSSANTFIRNLTLPALFHTIRLVVPSNSVDPKTFRTAQDKLVECIQGINVSPHVSRHIRYLKLDYWRPSHENQVVSAYLKYLDIESSLFKQTLMVYQLIIDLIPTLPRLSRLDLKECCLTQEALDSMFRSTSLESLRLNGFVLGGSVDTTLLVPLKVHTLEYCPGSAPGPSSEDMIASLLRQTSHLTVLCLPLSDIHLLHQTGQLSRLQKLTIFKNIPSNDNDEEMMMYNLLSLTPDLRELHLTGKIYGSNLDFPNTIVPRLESLTATPLIANCLASGRALRDIHILSFPQGTFLKSYNVVMKEATNVSYDSMLVNPKKEFSHLSSMFPNASTLRITAVRRCETTHEEISDAIFSVLPRFLRLRQCGVFDTGRCPTDMNRDRVYCPVGRRDDPTYRRHPTLQDLQILSWYRWRWVPKDGWRLVAVRYSPVDLWDNVFLDVGGHFILFGSSSNSSTVIIIN